MSQSATSFPFQSPLGQPIDASFDLGSLTSDGGLLWLHRLLDLLRRWLIDRGLARLQLDSLRLRLIKIAGWVRQRLDHIRVHLASSHPGEPLWRALASPPAPP